MRVLVHILLSWIAATSAFSHIARGLTYGRSALSMTSQLTVVGANGKTGQKVVYLCMKRNQKVRTVTTSGEFLGGTDATGVPIPVSSEVLTKTTGDVRSLASLREAVRGSDAVVFTASASKTGGDPSEVDRDGVINTAKACIEENVKRLVVVSSGAVTKKFSPVYLFLNLFGGIMKAKAEGEDGLRALYQSLGPSSELGYTIIRPGGLTEEPPVGCAGELIQM
jgi:nucleoside-diphosphate-sugar epimerase